MKCSRHWERIADDTGEERADQHLAFCADVPEPGAKGHGHSKSGEDQRRRQLERDREVGPSDEAAFDEGCIDLIGFWPTPATRIAANGDRDEDGRDRAKKRANELPSSQTEKRRDRIASVDMWGPIPASRRVGRRLGLVQSAHQAPDLLESVSSATEIGDDAPAIDDEDAVREGEDLVDVRGNDEDGAAAVAHLDEYAVDRLDRADVDAARRLLGDDRHAPARQLARKLNLLLIAAGKRASGRGVACAAHIEFADEFARAASSPHSRSRIGPRENSGRWPTVRFSHTWLVSDSPTRSRSAGI